MLNAILVPLVILAFMVSGVAMYGLLILLWDALFMVLGMESVIWKRGKD